MVAIELTETRPMARPCCDRCAAFTGAELDWLAQQLRRKPTRIGGLVLHVDGQLEPFKPLWKAPQRRAVLALIAAYPSTASYVELAGTDYQPQQQVWQQMHRLRPYFRSAGLELVNVKLVGYRLEVME